MLGVRTGSLTFLVPMSANCRPPSHQSILCILHFSPFLTKFVILAMCLAKNGKDTKHTRHIARRIRFVRNGEKCKMHKIDWCEGGLQLAEIGTKNISEPDLTPRMKYYGKN